MKETYTAVDPIERVHALECENEALRAKLSQVSKDMEYIANDRDNMKENLQMANEHIRDLNILVAVLQAQVDLVRLIFGGNR